LSTVELLILLGSVDVNARLPREFQPPALVHAAHFGRKEIVDLLLRASARVDETDERGCTACHFAAAKSRDDMLALLLARQPNLAVVDADGKTAFRNAVTVCRRDDGRCALMLLEAGASLDVPQLSDLCLFAATSTAAIQALLDRGIVVGALRDFGDGTPLHVAACRTSEAGVFDMLVNVCGIDLMARDRYGRTCFHSAASSGNDFAVRWLIAAGADVNVAASDGSTPLHSVVGRSCVVLLVAGGADVCARGNRGQTALHRVWNDMSTVHAFLAGGADLDAANDAGETIRQLFARCLVTIDPDTVDAARRDTARLAFVRERALEVCIGLRSHDLDALQVCEILQLACGPVASLIPFHMWWKIATAVKHCKRNAAKI
jgi:hypothetical protein